MFREFFLPRYVSRFCFSEALLISTGSFPEDICYFEEIVTDQYLWDGPHLS